MARAIIRCSLSDDTGSLIRNQVVGILSAPGPGQFASIGTFSYEGSGTEAALWKRLQQVLTLLHGLPGGVSLNNVWFYVDQAK